MFLYSPLADNFFVFIIFAANSRPVDFWTHLRTIEKAPLKQENGNENKCSDRKELVLFYLSIKMMAVGTY